MVLFKMASSSDESPDGRRSVAIFENLCLGDKDVKKDNLLFFLRFLQDEKPLKDPANAKYLTSKLKLLLSSDNKEIAICLLPHFIQYSSAETFSQNAAYWIRSILQFLNSKPSNKMREVALRSVANLLSLSSEFDDISREISLNVVHPLVNGLVSSAKANISDAELSIDVFRQCVISYPGPTGRFRSLIENICLQLLDSNISCLRTKACKCLARLPQCGSSGEKGMKFAEFWSKYNMLVSNTLTDLWLSLTQSNAMNKTDGLTFKLEKVPDAEPKRSQVISQRICCLFSVFKETISNSFPNIVKIDLEKTISLCCLLLDKEINLGDAGLETVCMNVVLPQIWLEILVFLNSLIAQTRSIILPYETIILQVVLKFFNLRNSKQNGLASALSKLRIQTYQVLCTWISTVGPMTNELISKIVMNALEDVCPVEIKDSTKIIPNEARGKQKKLSQSQKIQKELAEEEMTGKKIDRSANSDITFAALTFLEHLVVSSGPLLPCNVISDIQNHVISILMNLCASSKQVIKCFPPPYGSTMCRLHAYKCAFALFNLYHHQVSTPMSVFMSVFRMGLTDPALQVASHCQSCLSLADKIIRPPVPAIREYNTDALSAEPSTGAFQNTDESNGMLIDLKSTTSIEMGASLYSGFSKRQQMELGDSEDASKNLEGTSGDLKNTDASEQVTDISMQDSEADLNTTENCKGNSIDIAVGLKSFEISESRTEDATSSSDPDAAMIVKTSVKETDGKEETTNAKESKDAAKQRLDSHEYEQQSKRARIEKENSSSDNGCAILIADDDAEIEEVQKEQAQSKNQDSDCYIDPIEYTVIESDEETDQMLKSFVISLPDSE